MPPQARMTADNVNGGAITSGAPNVLVDGLPAAIVGSTVAPHSPFTGTHLDATVVQGSSKVFINGIPAAYMGALCSCGHTISTGSFDVITTP